MQSQSNMQQIIKNLEEIKNLCKDFFAVENVKAFTTKYNQTFNATTWTNLGKEVEGKVAANIQKITSEVNIGLEECQEILAKIKELSDEISRIEEFKVVIKQEDAIIKQKQLTFFSEMKGRFLRQLNDLGKTQERLEQERLEQARLKGLQKQALGNLKQENLLAAFNSAIVGQTDLVDAKGQFITQIKANLRIVLDLENSDFTDDDNKVKAFDSLAGKLFDSYAKRLEKDETGKFKELKKEDLDVTNIEAIKACSFALIKFLLIIPAVLELLGIGDKYLQSTRAQKNKAKAADITFLDSLASDKAGLVKANEQQSFKEFVEERKAAHSANETISK